MNFQWGVLFLTTGLFLGMVFLLELGLRIGRRMARDPEKAPTGIGAVEGALFGLLGLLIAFTFSGAAQRFDDRRHLVVQEANTIGTAWLRIDLLPADSQIRMRKIFREYLTSRLETYRKLPDFAAAQAELQRSMKLQSEIWKEGVAGCNQPEVSSCRLLLPVLNEMFDIVTTRTAAAQFHPPMIIFMMLVIMSLIASLFAGYGMAAGKRSWVHIIGFALIMALTIYVILDIEYPRLGLISVGAIDKVLEDLVKTMQ